MEKRRIQRTGKSSFSVTLPKKWVETHKLKEHDRVITLEDGRFLLLLPSSVVEKPALIEIQLGNLKEDDLKREIIACYILGFDELRLLGKPITKEERLVVRKTVQRLVGFEVIEDSSNQILLRNILHPGKFSFRESIEKMFFMTFSMLEDAISAVCENNQKLVQDLVERDYDIDKLYFLVLRQNRFLIQNRTFGGELRSSPLKVLYYEGIATQLERIADHAVKIAQTIGDDHPAFPKRFCQVFQKTAQEILSLLKEAEVFVTGVDKARARKVLSLGPKINKSITAFSLEVMKQNSIRAGILADSLDRAFGYIKNMAELTIDQSIVEESA